MLTHASESEHEGGTLRPVKKASLGLALLALLWIGTVQVFKTHDDAFTEEGLLEANAANLKDTRVTSHLEVPVASEDDFIVDLRSSEL